jgi:hypothetical protein
MMATPVESARPFYPLQKTNSGNWTVVQIALALMAAACILLIFVFLMIAPISLQLADRSFDPKESVLLLLAMGAAALLAGVLALAATVMYCFVPEVESARAMAIIAVIGIFVTGVIMAIQVFQGVAEAAAQRRTVPQLDPWGRPMQPPVVRRPAPREDAQLLDLMKVFANTAVSVCLTIFLRNVARHFGAKKLARNIELYLFPIGCLFFLQVGATFVNLSLLVEDLGGPLAFILGTVAVLELMTVWNLILLLRVRAAIQRGLKKREVPMALQMPA